MVFSGDYTIHRCVPSLQAIVSINGDKPVERKLQLILQMIKACWAFILESPLLAVALQGLLETLVDMVDNLEICVISVG
jgi:hypothetical protein